MKFFIFIIFNLLNSGNFLKIHNLIGNTPLVKLSNKINPYHNDINIYLKLEYYNPSGSIKDRIVNYIIQDGIQQYNLIASSSESIGCGRIGKTGYQGSRWNWYRVYILAAKLSYDFQSLCA